MVKNDVIQTYNVGKDAQPLDTVKRIKDILEQNGIKAEERWSESDVPHCYSLRINIEGTAIGANGKGTTREYALASGYGELIERLQLGLIWKNRVQIQGGTTSCEAQSTYVPADMLFERNAAWYDSFSKTLEQITAVSVPAKDILKQYTNSSGEVQATPYYCMTTGTTEYLPTALCKAVYKTSGGAAGNTIEEAMVQAISEIVERHHKLRIIRENIAVPEIPEEILKQYKLSYEIICFLRESGFQVTVKDCSLGTKFAVICVCIIDTNTGRYHTHFGAYPNFDVALQRTLTETFQGRNIRNIARHENFSKLDEAFDARHLLSELVKGTSEKSMDFFCKTSDAQYNREIGFAGTSNKERLKECVAFFKDQGYDILVRDSSTLGFPTCQIIIPGYSEVLPQRLLKQYNDEYYCDYAGRVLQDPVSACDDDLFGFIMHINQSKKLRVYGLEEFTSEAGIPANITPAEEAFYMSAALAHVSYSLHRMKDTISYLNNAIQANIYFDMGYLICLKRYLFMRQEQHSKDDTVRALKHFHKHETVEKLLSFVENGRNPLDPVVLRCDFQCAENCPLYGRCKRKTSDAMVRLIVEKAKQLDQSKLISALEAI